MKRARTAERTMPSERAIKTESTTARERAILHESTNYGERATITKRKRPRGDHRAGVHFHQQSTNQRTSDL